MMCGCCRSGRRMICPAWELRQRRSRRGSRGSQLPLGRISASINNYWCLFARRVECSLVIKHTEILIGANKYGVVGTSINGSWSEPDATVASSPIQSVRVRVAFAAGQKINFGGIYRAPGRLGARPRSCGAPTTCPTVFLISQFRLLKVSAGNDP